MTAWVTRLAVTTDDTGETQIVLDDDRVLERHPDGALFAATPESARLNTMFTNHFGALIAWLETE